MIQHYFKTLSLLLVLTLSGAGPSLADSADSWVRKADLGGSGATPVPEARTGAYAFTIDGVGYVGGGYDNNPLQDLWAYDTSTGEWMQRANFPTNTRIRPICFVLGGKAYVGGGEISYQGRDDIWMYDPATNTWSARNNMPGGYRMKAFSFVAGGKAYMGGGMYHNGAHFNDLWEYDTTADSWTQRASFTGARSSASAFGIGGKGYIVGGDSAGRAYADLQRYDPATDSWTSQAAYGGGPVRTSQTFQFGNTAYVVSGMNATGGLSEVWQYHPGPDRWTRKAGFPDGWRSSAATFTSGGKGYMVGGDAGYEARSNVFVFDTASNSWSKRPPLTGYKRYACVSFSIGGKGYTGTGITDTSFFEGVMLDDFWSYDTATNAWTQIAAFGGGRRSYASAFTIGDKGYVAAGNSPSGYTNDLWEYDPGTNAWTGLQPLPGAPRAGAAAFSIRDKGYLAGGEVSLSRGSRELFEYDPKRNSWAAGPQTPAGYTLSYMPGFSIGRRGFIAGAGSMLEYAPDSAKWIVRYIPLLYLSQQHLTAFTIGRRAFIGGINSTWNRNYEAFMEFDPDQNIATERAPVTGVRSRGVAFAIGNHGYLGGGRIYKDFWQYTPAGITTGPDAIPVCLNDSLSFDLPFFSADSFGPGNRFYAELSDADGSFASPQLLTPLPGSTGSLLKLQLPPGLHGPGYLIRVVADSPGITGSSAPIVFYNPEPRVNWSGGLLQTDAAYASYQWLLFNVPIAGATQRQYNPLRNGHYSVRVTDNAGCGGISAGIAVTGVSVPETFAGEVSVYPNPARDLVNVVSKVPVELRLYAIDGREISGKAPGTTVDLRGLPPGVYLLHIRNLSDSRRAVVRIVREL